jgi:uncharacterized protein YyaL (SSP411 family)
MPRLRDVGSHLSSPYLRQHVTNPVNWWEWGDDAFEEATRRDLPIFLSIGYAACHWCHVMAHESFENVEIARQLNDGFIAIKVDREERPDVDALYMSATQIVSGSGGWPMSVFLTPDGRPFMAGTYYAPVDRGGAPGFPRLLSAMSDAWSAQRQLVEQQADEIASAIDAEARFVDRLEPSSTTTSWSVVARHLRDELLERSHIDGGFGEAPKFPRPSFVEALLPFASDDAVADTISATLDAMSRRGLYDHLRGGFARYSVDNEWHVPHFEKMLSDQALLARVYFRAARALPQHPEWRMVALDTLSFVENDLHVDNGYASSLDADSDGKEGAHVTWTRTEVENVLNEAGLADFSADVCARYRIDDEGSFEGRSIPRLAGGESFLAPPELQSSLQALRASRARRSQPARDEKVILEWNAMFAVACFESDDEHFVAVGEALLHSLAATHFANGYWWRTNNHRSYATCADVAWYLQALLGAFEATGDELWLDRAGPSSHYLIEHFWDGDLPSPKHPNAGLGLFSSADVVTDVRIRSKEIFDGATPSSHAAATNALARYFLVTGDELAGAAARRLCDLAGSLLIQHPVAVVDLVHAWGFVDNGVEIVAPGAPSELVNLVRSFFVPNSVLITGNGSSPLLKDRLAGQVYVCRAGVCRLPVSSSDALQSELRSVQEIR